MHRTVSIKRLQELFIYDPVTGILVNRVRRNNCGNAKAGEEAGNPGPAGCRQVSVDNLRIYVHRVAWAMHTGEWPEVQIDHIDGNPSNNQIDNLRLASNAENQQNRGKYRTNNSGVKGVAWYRAGQKWHAQIQSHGKKYHLGYFDDIEEAAAAYRKAATELHGEFANFG